MIDCMSSSYGHFTSPTPSMSHRGIFNKTHLSLSFHHVHALAVLRLHRPIMHCAPPSTRQMEGFHFLWLSPYRRSAGALSSTFVARGAPHPRQNMSPSAPCLPQLAHKIVLTVVATGGITALVVPLASAVAVKSRQRCKRGSLWRGSVQKSFFE
jgi:hypothetical protein